MINLKKKLQNPVVLISQGFIAGGILFYATTPHQVSQPQQQSTYQALEKISEA